MGGGGPRPEGVGGDESGFGRVMVDIVHHILEMLCITDISVEILLHPEGALACQQAIGLVCSVGAPTV